MKEPAPKTVRVECDTCGLEWGKHKKAGGKVGLAECVRLLKAELSAARTSRALQQFSGTSTWPNTSGIYNL